MATQSQAVSVILYNMLSFEISMCCSQERAAGRIHPSVSLFFSCIFQVHSQHWAITVRLKTWRDPFLPWACLSLLLPADVPPCLKLGFLEAEQRFGGMRCPEGGSGEKGRGVRKQVGKGTL